MNKQKVDGNNVYHPTHYTRTSIECIDSMRMTFGTRYTILWCIMTAYKYLWRRDLKDNQSEDMAKAGWYLNYAQNLLNEDPDPVQDLVFNFEEVYGYYNRVLKEKESNE